MTATRIRCHECDSDNIPAARFCATCGSPLHANKESPNESDEKCGSEPFEARLSQLRQGMPKGEVLRLLGSPKKKRTRIFSGEEEWKYEGGWRVFFSTAATKLFDGEQQGTLARWE